MIARYLTGDPPDLADVSVEVIDGVAALLVTDVAIVETAYVLVSVNEVPRAGVVDGLIALLGKANFDTFWPDRDYDDPSYRRLRRSKASEPPSRLCTSSVTRGSSSPPEF